MHTLSITAKSTRKLGNQHSQNNKVYHDIGYFNIDFVGAI